MSGRIYGYIREKMSGTNFPTHSRALAEERKLEDSPNDRPGTNCTFTENTEHIAKHMFRPIASVLVQYAD